MSATPLLSVEGLVKHFPLRTGLFGRANGAVREFHAADGARSEWDAQRGAWIGARAQSGADAVVSPSASGGRIGTRFVPVDARRCSHT